MTKLHELLAIEKGIKSRNSKTVTELHKKHKSSASYTGFYRKYEPLLEDEPQLNPETKRVQGNAREELSQGLNAFEETAKCTFSKEQTNTVACADIVIDGVVVQTDVPVVVLVQIEKQLDDVKTFVENIPTLPFGEDWNYNKDQEVYESEETRKGRTRKVNKHKVLYEATKEHPAQIQQWSEDILCGEFLTRNFSTAIPPAMQREMLKRVVTAQDAVKAARQRANEAEVIERDFANLFAYIKTF